jgi:hypothetical protein
MSIRLALLLFLFPATATAQQRAAAQVQKDPQIAQLVANVSADSARAYLTRLVGFGTRHTMSDTVSATRGIGAARRYIYETFQRFSRACGGCLEVYYDAHDAVNPRAPGRPVVRVVNVVARLKGNTDPDRLVILMGHYDSCICTTDQNDFTSDAPGANDDGSGTVAVMELARVFSKQFPRGLAATVLFVPVAGEEQGLLGSGSMADSLATDSTKFVYAALTTDIGGNIRGQKGGIDSTSMRVFAGEPDDGPSRQLARYIEAVGEAYQPNVDVRVIERLDRIGRGGDHRPFWEKGSAAVRFSESLENYMQQHLADDKLEFVHFPYVQKVARINGAATAHLALAPAPPDSARMQRLREGGGADWKLSWRVAPGATRYEITVRKTTEAHISRVVDVGNVTEYTLLDTQADDLWIGIRSVGPNGHRSLIRSFHTPERLPSSLTTPRR